MSFLQIISMRITFPYNSHTQNSYIYIQLSYIIYTQITLIFNLIRHLGHNFHIHTTYLHATVTHTELTYILTIAHNTHTHITLTRNTYTHNLLA